MLRIEYTSKMKRDVRRVAKRGKDMTKLTAALDFLASGNPMPPKYKDHHLKGDMEGFRECHLEADWLLVYQIVEDKLLLLAAGTGRHTDLFEE